MVGIVLTMNVVARLLVALGMDVSNVTSWCYDVYSRCIDVVDESI